MDPILSLQASPSLPSTGCEGGWEREKAGCLFPVGAAGFLFIFINFILNVHRRPSGLETGDPYCLESK